MSVNTVEEYETAAGEIIGLETEGPYQWTVSNWEKDTGVCRWSLAYSNEAEARVEFERWRK